MVLKKVYVCKHAWRKNLHCSNRTLAWIYVFVIILNSTLAVELMSENDLDTTLRMHPGRVRGPASFCIGPPVREYTHASMHWRNLLMRQQVSERKVVYRRLLAKHVRSSACSRRAASSRSMKVTWNDIQSHSWTFIQT